MPGEASASLLTLTCRFRYGLPACLPLAFHPLPNNSVHSPLKKGPRGSVPKPGDLFSSSPLSIFHYTSLGSSSPISLIFTLPPIVEEDRTTFLYPTYTLYHIYLIILAG